MDWSNCTFTLELIQVGVFNNIDRFRSSPVTACAQFRMFLCWWRDMSCISYILQKNNKAPGYYEVAADMIKAVGPVRMQWMNGIFIVRLFWPSLYCCCFLFLIFSSRCFNYFCFWTSAMLVYSLWFLFLFCHSALASSCLFLSDSFCNIFL